MMSAVPNGLPPPPLTLLENASLFLDFDGTLVELASRPHSLEVTDHPRSLIRRAAEKLQGRVAIVSGRPVSQIDALLGSQGLAVSGSHGLEVRGPDGVVAVPALPVGLGRVAAAMMT